MAICLISVVWSRLLHRRKCLRSLTSKASTCLGLDFSRWVIFLACLFLYHLHPKPLLPIRRIKTLLRTRWGPPLPLTGLKLQGQPIQCPSSYRLSRVSPPRRLDFYKWVQGESSLCRCRGSSPRSLGTSLFVTDASIVCLSFSFTLSLVCSLLSLCLPGYSGH